MRLATLLLACSLIACGDKDDKDDEDEDDDGGTADGSDGADGSEGTDSGAGSDGSDGTDALPADPSPFVIQVTGALEQSISFNQPTCSRPNGSTNLRQFWRGEGHVFVLKVEVMGVATGPDTYTSAEHGVRATLQEEAGGTGLYFASGSTDTVEMVVTGLDDDLDQAWGHWTVSSMADTAGGTITITPQPLPIWCPMFL